MWRRLRDEAPVYRNDRYDFWALSRFADVEAAHRDPATFSSARGTVLELMGAELSGAGIIFMDPPDHTSQRALVSRAFTPRRMAAMEDHVRAICSELLDGVQGEARFDYVQDFAAQLPSRVISELVGVPEADREEQRRNIDGLLHLEAGVGMVNDVALEAHVNLHRYLGGLVVERRDGSAGDDLISVLCGAEVTDEDGEVRRLGNREVTNFATLLYGAGTETVMRLLGNAAVLLAEHPEQRDALVEDPALIADAVEELLRFEAPSPVQGRWTTRPVTVEGTTIPSDAKVLLLTGSAGRDERAFPDPDTFDVRREMRQHLSFGYGIHYCVGAALARLEGRVALEETLRRFPSWRVDPEAVVRQHTSTVRGYSRVVIEPDAALRGGA